MNCESPMGPCLDALARQGVYDSYPSLLTICGLFSPLFLNHFLCRFLLGYSSRWLIISSFGDLFGVAVRSSFWITISSI
ncbi:hypothetical protein H5410_047153 [Solanum commersonii]|uniref:Uncharacterized protein n=1 Tax=Solanum commersonii TaxID=4109 RepID=A0A9J5XGE8_SOLCO|nr:hypothetical protein H5410_047153 [Solanum commersonii]